MNVSIIGSGIGGLSAAIRLRNKGHDVNVFEKNNIPGGKLSTFKLGEFRFDAGPSLFTMPVLVDELFEICNENPRDYFNYKKKDIHCKYHWDDGTKFIAYSNKLKFINEIIKKFNVDEDVIRNYLKKAEKKYNLTENIFLKKSLHKFSTFTNIETLKALFQINIFQINKTLDQVNTKELKNDYLTQIFNRYATYNGSSPYQTPGMMTLIQHLENNYGTYIPEGGMYEISNSLFKLAKKIGVKFNFNSNVSNINVSNSKIESLTINNKIKHKSDYFMSNIDTNYFYNNLFEKKINHPSLKEERSSSAIIFYWGMNKVFEKLDLHNIFFSSNYKEEFRHIFKKKELYDDPTVYINITSKDVVSDAPKGCENWFVMINSPYDTGQDWNKIIKSVKRTTINKINSILNTDIEDFIEFEKVFSPKTLEKNTQSYLGSLYGSSSNDKTSAFLRHPNFSKHIQNLYFCGGSVHPGGGIPLCLLSAKIVSELIKKQ